VLERHFKDPDMTMQQFCELLEDSPIEIYMQLAIAYQTEGENFSFPPFKEVIDYLRQRCGENVVFQKITEKLSAENFPFHKTNLFLQHLLLDFSSLSKPLGKQQSWYIDELVSETEAEMLQKMGHSITPIDSRVGQMTGFKFACNAELTVPFFIKTRGVPIFPLGVCTEMLPFDASHGTLNVFYDHDRAHAAILKQGDAFYLQKHNKDVYPILDFHLFSIYTNELIKGITNPFLQDATALLLFQLLHEDGNKKKHCFTWDKEDMISGLEVATKTVTRRISENFAYPEQYKRVEMFEYLDAAAELITIILATYNAPVITDAENLSYLQPSKEDYLRRVRKLDQMKDNEIEKYHAQHNEYLIMAIDQNSQRKKLLLTQETNYSAIREAYAKELACYFCFMKQDPSPYGFEEIAKRFQQVRDDLLTYLSSEQYSNSTGMSGGVLSFLDQEATDKKQVIVDLVKKEVKALESDFTQLDILGEALLSDEPLKITDSTNFDNRFGLRS
jgi:hypothetical protein